MLDPLRFPGGKLVMGLGREGDGSESDQQQSEVDNIVRQGPDAPACVDAGVAPNDADGRDSDDDAQPLSKLKAELALSGKLGRWTGGSAASSGEKLMDRSDVTDSGCQRAAADTLARAEVDSLRALPSGVDAAPGEGDHVELSALGTEALVVKIHENVADAGILAGSFDCTPDGGAGVGAVVAVEERDGASKNEADASTSELTGTLMMLRE
jgi:hypothetical protein